MWCRKHIDLLREGMPLVNGIASVSTACRILARIDEELFTYEFMEWIGSIVNTRGTHLAIDGKALRAAMSKVRNERTPMVLNVIDVPTGLVVGQMPMSEKDCEITTIPELLKLLDIKGSVVTIDAIGTQTGIMEQIIAQGGDFVLTVKRNQPEAYREIMEHFDGINDLAQRGKDLPESYGQNRTSEKNRDRYEYRTYEADQDCTCISKFSEEWHFLETIGRAGQVRVPLEKDEEGNDITPEEWAFLKNGSQRAPRPCKGDGEKSDIQLVGLISSKEMSAKELGDYKRGHWAIENSTHHVLDESFREDRSPAKKSKNNLALIRKIAYNILRISGLKETCSLIISEAMDDFCDDHSLIRRYVFNGIPSFY